MSKSTKAFVLGAAVGIAAYHLYSQAGAAGDPR